MKSTALYLYKSQWWHQKTAINRSKSRLYWKWASGLLASFNSCDNLAATTEAWETLRLDDNWPCIHASWKKLAPVWVPDLSLFFSQGHFQLWAGTAYLPVIKSLTAPPLTRCSLVNMNCQSFKSQVARLWQFIQRINPTQRTNQSICLSLSAKVASRIAIITPALQYPSAARHLPVLGGNMSCILDTKLPCHFAILTCFTCSAASIAAVRQAAPWTSGAVSSQRLRVKHGGIVKLSEKKRALIWHICSFCR